jgi:hypothetical protein
LGTFVENGELSTEKKWWGIILNVEFMEILSLLGTL